MYTGPNAQHCLMLVPVAPACQGPRKAARGRRAGVDNADLAGEHAPTRREDPRMRGDGVGQRFAVRVTLAALALIAALLAPGSAGAQFTVAGRKVPPAETNFAGIRQVTPRYGLVVQINHDTRTAGDFEL